MKTPCGEWIDLELQDGPMLLVDSWFIPVDGWIDVLKPEVAQWLKDHEIDYFWSGYSALGAALTFKTVAGAMLFRMFWDDRVPR